MVNCLLKSALVAAVVLVASALSNDKLFTCCKTVSTEEITEPIIKFKVQKSNPPCVTAVIFTTNSSHYCAHLRAPWVHQKIKDFMRAKAQTSVTPVVTSSSPSSSSSLLLSIMTSTVPSSSSTVSSSSSDVSSSSSSTVSSSSSSDVSTSSSSVSSPSSDVSSSSYDVSSASSPTLQTSSSSSSFFSSSSTITPSETPGTADQ
uniref:Cell wall integrity and stress response component 1 n=1 Tax=Fundulus heteroclitus TaxID=8078 RepID=A0A3Q2PH56_FUNHE